MTASDPAAYESLERRLDTVLGADDAGTMKTVLASLATKYDLRNEITGVRADFDLVVLALHDLKQEVAHRAELADERVHRELVSLTKWLLPTIFGGITAMGAAAGLVVAVAG